LLFDLGFDEMSIHFDTHLLDQVLRDRQRLYEQTRQQVLDQVLDWLEAFGHSYGIESAYLFGSITQLGRFHENSDVDLAVEQIDPVRQIDAIADLSLALLRDVDIVDLRRCHFADRIRTQGQLWTKSS
jgi:hypothetical protein